MTIKLGAYFPTSSSGRNTGGNGQFSLGLDYALVKTTSASPILPSVYFDYQGGSRHDGHANSYGLGVAARYYTTLPGAATTAPYFGAGVGVYDEDLKQGSSGSNHAVSVGAKLLAGIEFRSALVEVNYQFLPKHNGVNPDGLGVQIGYRF